MSECFGSVIIRGLCARSLVTTCTHTTYKTTYIFNEYGTECIYSQVNNRLWFRPNTATIPLFYLRVHFRRPGLLTIDPGTTQSAQIGSQLESKVTTRPVLHYKDTLFALITSNFEALDSCPALKYPHGRDIAWPNTPRHEHTDFIKHPKFETPEAGMPLLISTSQKEKRPLSNGY